MNKYVERIYNGVWKENPSFVQMLGLCPTLAVTTSAMNGIGMGLSTTVVLVAANIVIAASEKPDSGAGAPARRDRGSGLHGNCGGHADGGLYAGPV